MAGKKFLNPTIKIMICLSAITVLGYFVVQEAIFQNDPVNKFLIGRLLVMIGFVYLLVQSLRELLQNR
jgi:TRAP-type mannitol/chloroaromatic compound transport system permease small subunit